MAITVITDALVILSANQHGQVETSDAIAIDGNRIVAVGDSARAMVDLPDTTLIDATGRTILPGVGDGHAHPIFAGLELLGPEIRSGRTPEDIASNVKAFADANPDLEWIVGGSYDSSIIPGGLFDATWLDSIDRPVVLNAWDYHTVWVNSEALRRAGITSETPEPELGRIIRRPDGTPLGTLQEYGAIDLMKAVMPADDAERLALALKKASDHFIELGVTWVQDAWVDPHHVDGYLQAAAKGFIRNRFNLALRAEPTAWRPQVETFPLDRERIRSANHPLLTCNTVKFFADGVVENHTAAMIDPYTDRVEQDDRGIANWTQEELTAAAIEFDRLGFQLHIHAIGDMGNRLALNAFEEVERVNGPRDRRGVIAHVQILEPSDLGRFAQLGVIANFEPYWAQMDPLMTELTLPRIGHRSAHQYRIVDVIESGAYVTFGSDWPVTTPDWRSGLEVGITRETSDGVPEGGWEPSQRVSPAQGVWAYTAAMAHQAFADDSGVLTPGSIADFIELSANPLEIEPHKLPSIRVLATWVDGIRNG